MTETKPWYLSSTVIGAILSLVATLVSLMSSGANSETLAFLKDQSVAIADGLVGIVGAALAIVGRIRADKRIA